MGKSLKVFQQEALGIWLERLREAQCGEQTRGSKSGSRDQKSSKRLWWALPQRFSTEQSSQKTSTKQVIYGQSQRPPFTSWEHADSGRLLLVASCPQSTWSCLRRWKRWGGLGQTMGLVGLASEESEQDTTPLGRQTLLCTVIPSSQINL